MMKWIMIVVFISTMFTGCYVPHPANDVGVSTSRMYYTEVCTYNYQTKKWVCIQTRKRVER